MSKWREVGECGRKGQSGGEVVIAMFMGQYEHNIDAKGRAIIPVRYREELGESFIVARGFDGCLYLYPQSEWDALVNTLRALPSNKKTRTLQRELLGTAMDVTLDKQGRILIPANLRQLARLEKELVFIGVMNRVEVWDKTTYEAQAAEGDETSLEDAMDDLGISL